MSKDFCLLDEPWLPVRLADGRVLELGLLELFERSGEIVALAETAPPSLVAQYRLLLAITHRALVTALGNWRDKDRVRWYREGLPLAEIRAYLERWRERFWLFHPEYPFMQVAALASCPETAATYPPSTISVELFYGTEMFNQDVYSHAPWLAPESIRALLGYLQFVPGGFFPGKKLKSSEKAGPLVNTAAVLPVGQTLGQTLCLALHASPRADAEPDLPSWERAPLTIADLRGEPLLASGPNDRYTRQSRAVLFLGEGSGLISKLHFAAGLSLSEDPNAPDPMASFRVGSNDLVRLRFEDGRSLWRDLPALVPNAGAGSQAAAVVQGAVALHRELTFETVYQPLLVAGLSSDQGKLLRWRMEQIALPSVLLLEPEKAQHLRERVAAADALYGELKRLATGMLAETMPEPGHKDTRSRARSLVEAGPLAACYFATAERTLPELLRLISEGQAEPAEALWCQALRQAAEQAWQQVLQGLGSSARALRADACYWPRLHGLLNKQVPLPASRVTDKEVVS